jgi:tetratricopeptide (TPR) repeat protein
MASIAWKSLIVVAGILALASEPVIGQDQEKTKDLATCADVAKDANARLEACTRSLERDRNDSLRRWAIIMTYRASALKAKGELDSAVAALTDAIEADPNFAVPYNARGDIFRDRGQCDQAIADYDRLIQLVPERAAIYVSRGVCWMQKREYDPAMGNFEEAIRLDPNNANRVGALARVMKGRLRYLKGDLDGAIADYDEAIKLEPNNARFRIDRATAWSNKSARDRALADIEQAIKLDPNNANGAAALAWSMKAGLRFAKDDLDGAIADYDEAIRLDPQSAVFYIDRGTVWGSKREFARALADFDQAIKLDPNNVKGAGATAWNLKGRVQFTQGDVDGAIAAYDEAVRLNPKFAFAHQNRGDAFKEKGEYARAIESYDRAIDLQAREPSIYASRGLMHFYIGNFPKAAADFTQGYQGKIDSYSLLLTYLSLSRAGQDGKDELTRGASRLESKDWPYPVIELFLGRKSLEDIRGVAANSDRQCEVQYYAGEWYLLHAEKEPARQALQTAVNSCPKDFVEYRAAVSELKRLR